MYCTKCGKLNQPTDLKCNVCGQPLQNVAINKTNNKTYVMKQDCAIEELQVAK